MTNIEIVFPSTGGSPIVIHENEAVVMGRKIFWDIRSDNPDVVQVKIEFKEAGSTFFPEFSPAHAITKPLDKGKRVIYGTAPEEKAGKPHKYTVYGLDAEGNSLGELDPQIMSVKPPQLP